MPKSRNKRKNPPKPKKPARRSKTAGEPVSLRLLLMAAVFSGLLVALLVGGLLVLVVGAMSLYHGDLVPRFQSTWRVLVSGPLLLGGIAGLSTVGNREFIDRLAWHWNRWRAARRDRDDDHDREN